MQPNPYKNLLGSTQPAITLQPQVMPQPLQYQQQSSQQANTQAYVYNPQQYYVQQQQQQATYNNPYAHYNPTIVVPFDQQNQQVQSPINISTGITNQSSFMLRILFIYILEYVAQIILVFVFLQSQNAFASLFIILLPLAIIIPIMVWNMKGLQTNLTSAIVIIIYQVVYAALLVSLIAIGTYKKEKPKEGTINFGDNFSVALFALVNLSFNVLGLIQLVILFIIMQFSRDNFTMKQFKMVGSIISVICAVPFIPMHVLAFAFVAGLGITYNLWFASGLAKAIDERFGLKQNQVVFGSFAVFVFMACPCAS